MRIDKNSYGTLALVYLISVAVVAVTSVLRAPTWLVLAVCAFALAFCIWQTMFFRVPRRTSVGSDTTVTAVADGRIVIIDRVYEPECLQRDCIQVSIYMNFWDVHANFWPVSGEVTYYRYHPGRHLLAFKPKASEQNEHTSICIRTDKGEDVFFKQLAGTFARRIVCYAKPGLKVRAGEQCGIIKFGSRIDMYLPLDADIKTSLGFEPRACETVIAELV
ncbi:MAG: phosphatidylserine decarboxylase [Bacteroidales bacterium]|nr:phosphatidylserine decarboxylase [Bacteroidales bacterium]